MSKSIKKRNWAFFVYPSKEYLDSIGTLYDGADGYGTAPENWKDILRQTGLQAAISPLHDKDILEDGSGRIKKPHWHVIVCYNGPTSFNVVKVLTDQLNSPIPQALEQVRGYYRYLTHKDNPEKYQYSELEIKTVNGFNISDYVELTRSEVTQIKKSLQLLIRQCDIMEYSDLMDYLQDNELNVEYEVASNNTYFFDKYIFSRRNNSMRVFLCDDTGTKNTQKTHKKHTEKCCSECGCLGVVKNGKTALNRQRWRCRSCGKTFVIGDEN